MLYQIKSNKLIPIGEKNNLERDVQNLVAQNLPELLDLELVEIEFSIEKIRIDILAFNREVNAPVIIELKKDNSKSLFDQGMEYFNILSDRKANFLLKLHEKLNIPAELNKINWENSRVVFIGRNFSARQKRAVDFDGIPIELWDYDWYKNDLFRLEKIGLKKTAQLEISGVGEKTDAVKKVKREFQEYDREHHKSKANEKIWNLFEKIESELLSWDGVEENYRKLYISFFSAKSFCVAKLYQSKIEFEFGKKKDFNVFDSIKNVKNISSKDWNHSFLYEIKDESGLSDLFFLLRKSYELTSKK
jgi:predicted transport protein